MLSMDLANLYDVPAKTLHQAVKRNLERFPDDFMFQLTWEEVALLFPGSGGSLANVLRSQFVTLKQGKHIKYLPYAFSEQGVAMLSSVLRSPKAIKVNIEIMRAFVRMRELVSTHKDLAEKIDHLEKKYDSQFQVVFDAIRRLMTPPSEDEKKRIGFVSKSSQSPP